MAAASAETTGPGGPESQLDGFLASPRETLAIELKRWLDLKDPEVKAKIARHLMAIANHGGGWIQFGFEDPRDGTYPHQGARCPDTTAYSTDAINSIVERYARPAFHCEVMWRDCQEGCPGPHAFIRVEGGHKIPVVCSRNGPEPNLDPHAGTVYSRLPGPKSAPVIQPEDWHVLLERCMRARRDELIETFRNTVQLLGAEGVRAALDGETDEGEDDGGGSAVSPDIPRPPDGGDSTVGTQGLRREVARSRDVDLEDWTTESEGRLAELQEEEPADVSDPYADGSWSFAYRLVPRVSPPVPLAELRQDLLEVVGSETGWPAWWWPSGDPDRSPRAMDQTIECWMRGGVFSDPAHADFWRVSSDLQLFLLRGYDEDAAAQLSPNQHGGLEPGVMIDPTLPIWRVGECLLHAERLSRRHDASRVAIEIRWRGLKGRKMGTLDPLHYHWSSGISQTDRVDSWLTVEADLIGGSLPQLVQELTANLFAQFDFFEMPLEAVERELDRLRGIKPN